MLGVGVEVAHLHDGHQHLAIVHVHRNGLRDLDRADLPGLAAEPAALPQVTRQHALQQLPLVTEHQLFQVAGEGDRRHLELPCVAPRGRGRDREEEPVEGVRIEGDGVRPGPDGRERRASEHLDRRDPLHVAEVELHRLRVAGQVRHDQDPLVLVLADEREHAGVVRKEEAQRAPAEGPVLPPEADDVLHPPEQRVRVVLLGVDVQRLVVVLGSMMTGEYSFWGLAWEKPAFRSGLHCIGVRTPFRSPR